MTLSRASSLSLGAALLFATLSATAGNASLQDDAHLVALLTTSPQCCVVDARSTQRRQEAELPGALVYRDDLLIKPSGVVVVLADADAKALAVARTLAKSSPYDVYAVKGGFVAWNAIELRLQAQAGKPGSKFTFVVPHNTCEQGAPLQVFEAKPARPAASKPR